MLINCWVNDYNVYCSGPSKFRELINGLSQYLDVDLLLLTYGYIKSICYNYLYVCNNLLYLCRKSR